MTVSNQVAKSPLYSGNGVTTAFSTTFPFQNNSDLGVYRLVVSTGVETKLVLNTNYTVTGAGSPSGGTVTISPAPTSDHKIRITREAPYTQTTDYVEGTSFPAETHELALDKATMLIQQVKEAVDRAPQMSVTSSTYPLVFPSGGTSEAGKVLQWASPGGTTLVNTLPSSLDLSLTGGDAITISGHYTFDVDINKQSQIGTVDKNADHLLIRDATDGLIKKVLPNQLPTGDITGGAAINVDGANQISIDFIKQTSATPTINEDYILFYDSTDGGYKKALLNTVASTLTGGSAINISSNTINVDITKQSSAAVDRSNDLVLLYDTSGAANIKATPASFSISAMVQDTTPKLGADLDLNNFTITSTGHNVRLKALTTGNVSLEPGTSGVVAVTPSSGTPTLRVGSDVDIKKPSGTSNIAIGSGALNSSTGAHNIMVGASAGGSVTSGSTLIGIGTSALASATTSLYNVGVGYEALKTTVTSQSNVAIGYQSLLSLTTGGFNFGLGHRAGAGITTGNNNVCIGLAAGTNDYSGAMVTTGSTNVLIGAGATMTTSSGTNGIAIGVRAEAAGATGTTASDQAGDIALGSALCPVGLRGNNTPWPTAGSSVGYLRIKINGTYYRIQLYADS